MTLAVFVAYVAFLLVRGFGRRAGFATWHMFAGYSRCYLDLRHRDGTPFNPWAVLPHSQLNANARTLTLLLGYMRICHRQALDGSVEVHEGFDVKTVEVRDGRLVA